MCGICQSDSKSWLHLPRDIRHLLDGGPLRWTTRAHRRGVKPLQCLDFYEVEESLPLSANSLRYISGSFTGTATGVVADRR
jgi:hypothetical protein